MKFADGRSDVILLNHTQGGLTRFGPWETDCEVGVVRLTEQGEMDSEFLVGGNVIRRI